MKYIFLICLMTIPIIANKNFDPQKYLNAMSTAQIQTCQLVNYESSKYTDKYGNRFQSWFTAQVITESSSGRDLIGDLNSEVRKASLGDFQIQLKTAKWLASMYKEISWILKLSDNALVNQLVTNKQLSIQIAVIHYMHYRNAGCSHEFAMGIFNGRNGENPKYIAKLKQRKQVVDLMQQQGLLTTIKITKAKPIIRIQ